MAATTAASAEILKHKKTTSQMPSNMVAAKGTRTSNAPMAVAAPLPPRKPKNKNNCGQ